MLFGVLGAIVALFLLLGAASFLEHPLQELAELYQMQSLIYQLQASEIGWLILTGGLIGWLAARWSVARHLREIKPR